MSRRPWPSPRSSRGDLRRGLKQLAPFGPQGAQRLEVAVTALRLGTRPVRLGPGEVPDLSDQTGQPGRHLLAELSSHLRVHAERDALQPALEVLLPQEGQLDLSHRSQVSQLRGARDRQVVDAELEILFRARRAARLPRLVVGDLAAFLARA